MPGFDGLGPRKEGPMTGKGRGYCMKKLDSEEKANLFSGFKGLGRRKRGMGKGKGMGSGRSRNK
ncbi:MAG: DUF5320 domain-containing protein [Clostridia bacterium]|nr:DUF5320 domain-containing protein [Clostridia bacterium]